MTSWRQSDRPTVGVLAGWQFYRTATNLSYLKPVFAGMARAARDLDCNLLLGCGMGASASPADPPRPAWPIPAADSDYLPIGPDNVDGLLACVPLHSAARSHYLQALIAARFPVLFVGSGEKGPTLSADNAGGISEAVAHLIGHGHRRIAFIAGSPDDLEGDTGVRLRAYHAALAGHGLAVDPRLITYGRHIYDGGYAALRQILDGGAAFTAVLASNDEMALGAMQALKEAGRSIPHDVAVIGFDNRLEGAAHRPALSSLRLPLFSMGYQAVELLVRHLAGQAALPALVTVPTRLVARASCGCGEANPPPAPAAPHLIPEIAALITRQAQSLAENEVLALSHRLVDAFTASAGPAGPAAFSEALDEVLQATIAGDDAAHVWQEAVTRLEQSDLGVAPPARALLGQARLTISAAMQQQHLQSVVEQRSTNSRLSLLTASLLTALDTARIYAILAEHLPAMGVTQAQVVLFEAEGADPYAWSQVQAVLAPEPPQRAATRSFPAGLTAAAGGFRWTLIPLADQTGPLGFMAFGTDQLDLYGAIVQQLGGALNTARLYHQATEGRRLAEEANRLKSRFLSTISHELRTPLNLIVGLSSLMLHEGEKDPGPLPPATRQDLDRIRAYSQHLGALIGDVIDLATSEAGQLRLNNDYVDLGQALRMVAESGYQLAADKGLSWEADLPEAGPWVWGDQTRLRQVALNLINNAVKFTTHGSVSLRLVDQGQTVAVQVRDTGLGIPPAEQAVIFDEFRQSERSIHRGFGGLGLGLAICRRLVALHGGTLTVESTGEEGAGSTFTFTLPALQPPADRTRPWGPLAEAEPNVWILTNHPGTASRLGAQLQERGFNVLTAPLQVPADGAWPADLTRLDTLILDVSTDAALGWEVLRAIKSHPVLAGVPTVFYRASAAAEAALELDYLTKPIEISGLNRALDQHWLLTDSARPTRTVLVVDDEPNTLDLHARIVQSHSSANRVVKAPGGQAALEVLRREVVDLVLLDLQMPDLDGFAVLDAMRGQAGTRDIPVIVISGQTLTAADMARLNQGVTAVLGKGLFSLEETAAHIGAALEHKRRLSREAQRLVRTAMAYLHSHYAEPVSRRTLAQHVGITEDHLTYCFRQELGTTPVEYLQRYRIQQAKRRLKETADTITKIAGDVGFSDSGYFSRLFRRETGVSPEAFRRS